MTHSTHSTGGGRIEGTDASVGSDCLIDKLSTVEGRSFISYQSTLAHSGVKDSSIVFSHIKDSAIINSHVAKALVSRSGLQDVVVRGVGERSAVIQNSVLTEVTVEGCTVRNVELEGPYHLHSDWNHTPKHRLLTTENGVIQGMSECSGDNDSFHLGCECRPYKVWDAREHLLRRYYVGHLGWPADAFDSIRITFEQWRSQG